jgi:hypothetical protein
MVNVDDHLQNFDGTQFVEPMLEERLALERQHAF